MFLVENQRKHLFLNLSNYILISCIAKKLSGYTIGIKMDKYPSAIEKSNYSTKIINVYILYHLDAWPRKPTNNFKFKNCLLCPVNVLKNSDKGKYVYSGYGIT